MAGQQTVEKRRQKQQAEYLPDAAMDAPMAGCNGTEFRPPPREQGMSSSRWKVAENRAELAGRFGDDEDDVDDGECGALMETTR